MLSCWYGDLTFVMLVGRFGRALLSCWYGDLTFVMLVGRFNACHVGMEM